MTKKDENQWFSLEPEEPIAGKSDNLVPYLAEVKYKLPPPLIELTSDKPGKKKRAFTSKFNKMKNSMNSALSSFIKNKSKNDRNSVSISSNYLLSPKASEQVHYNDKFSDT